MKIGCIPSEFDARPDIVALTNSLSRHGDIVYFLNSKPPFQLQGETRPLLGLRDGLKFKWHSKIWHYFGRVPRSVENYRINELFRNNTFANRLRLVIRTANPIPLSLSGFLDAISDIDRSDLEGIDAFLLTTQITDNAILGRLIKTGIPTFLYIYSWDHACKHTNIYNQCAGYFVWNRLVASDLVNLCGIAPERIHVVGATQLCPLLPHINMPSSNSPSGVRPATIYFGSAVGLPELAKEEVKVVKALHNACTQTNRPFRLIFRPYPFMKDWSFYHELRSLPCIEFDEWDRPRDQGYRYMDDQETTRRLEQLKRADAFFHLGTTMGLECCFFSTPSFLIDLETFISPQGVPISGLLKQFCRQYHLKHHLQRKEFRNYISSFDELSRVVSDLLYSRADPNQFLSYNKAIASDFPQRALDEIADDIFMKISNILT